MANTDKSDLHIATQTVHGDISQRRVLPDHSLITPTVQTSTYTFANTAELCAYQEAKLAGTRGDRREYARYGNPTVRSVERRLAALEGAEGAMLFPTGMAAITNVLLSMLPTGSHVIFTDDCYNKTRDFCNGFLARLGIETTQVPMGDYVAMATAVTPQTRIIVSETPTNPYLRVVDLEQIVAITRQHRRIKTIIDATFATPINLRPLDYGIDLVIHSATKYLSGHNDIMAGVVLGRNDLLNPLRQSQGVLGGILDPHAAYLLERGLKTLALRVGQQNCSAQTIADYLESHPAVERVWYPGLPSHPDHAIARRQMNGYGGVVSFEVVVAEGEEAWQPAARVVDALQIPYLAPSLGGVESLVMQPALVSYYALSTAERLAIGIKDNLIRLAVGIEDTDDLIADLAQALEKIRD